MFRSLFNNSARKNLSSLTETLQNLTNTTISSVMQYCNKSSSSSKYSEYVHIDHNLSQTYVQEEESRSECLDINKNDFDEEIEKKTIESFTIIDKYFDLEKIPGIYIKDCQKPNELNESDEEIEKTTIDSLTILNNYFGVCMPTKDSQKPNDFVYVDQCDLIGDEPQNSLQVMDSTSFVIQYKSMENEFTKHWQYSNNALPQKNKNAFGISDKMYNNIGTGLQGIDEFISNGTSTESEFVFINEKDAEEAAGYVFIEENDYENSQISSDNGHESTLVEYQCTPSNDFIYIHGAMDEEDEEKVELTSILRYFFSISNLKTLFELFKEYVQLVFL